MESTVQSMIKHVNNLIQGQAVDLAFSVERAITASFSLPNSISEKIQELPEQYRETIEASFQKSLFKSFDSGYQYGLTLDKKTTASIPPSLKSSLVSSFNEDVADFTEGKVLEIGEGLVKAYVDGYEQAFISEEKVEAEQNEVTASEEGESKKKNTHRNGMPTLQNSANIDQKDVIKHMEEYISKLDPVAQEVMRYELGIQYGGSDGSSNNGVTSPKGMMVQAQTEDDIDNLPSFQLEADASLGIMVGPYAVSLLCDETINTVMASDIEQEECYALLDHVITNTKVLSEIELIEAICDKLDFPYNEKLTLAEVKDMADELAADLTEACRLPGNYVFFNNNGNYSLAFVFNKSTMEPVVNAVTARMNKVTATSVGDLSLQPPQGTLSTKIQKEIQNLAGLKSLADKSLRDLKRVSPGVASFLSRTISNYRSGKCTHKELSSLLSISSRDLIEMVYGGDGVGYYDYFTKG